MREYKVIMVLTSRYRCVAESMAESLRSPSAQVQVTEWDGEKLTAVRKDK